MIGQMRLCFMILLVLAVSAPAQTVSTEILGLVTDSSGAVIVGATVKATQVATGDVRTATTNATGNYIFPIMQIGEYEVTCVAPGFKTEVIKDVVLQLQQKARLNFQLQVGQQVEVVEISGRSLLLRTEDATLGSVIESKRVVDLPLNGRNFGQLATLMPGVVFGVSRMGVDGQGTIGTLAMPGQLVGISANGQRDANQNITLDGVVAVDSHHSAMLFTPSIEAIEEFKIQSAVYSAEYGMNSGAQVNVAIKSGTNQLHGSLFHFLRNDKLDARGFFLRPEAPKNELRRNQFGGTASGPVKKNKTFWLFSFEGRRERRATPSTSAVPTLAMRNGDFSEILQSGNRWYPSDANPAATRAIRLPGDAVPLPNNVIPATRLNRVAVNLLTFKKTSPFADGGFLARPNIDEQARANRSTVNLAGTDNQILDSNQYLGRLDHRFSDSDRVFGRYVVVDSNWGNVPLTSVSRFVTDYRAQNLGLGYSKILSPTKVNDFRFGMNRMRDVTSGLQTDTDFTQRDLGLDLRVVGDGNRPLSKFEEGLPSIGITGFSGISSGDASFDTKIVYEWSDNLSINRGKHNFKFGGLFRQNIVNFGGSNLPRGQINFTRDIVGIPDAFAAFMLGVPLSANSAQGVPLGFIRQKKLGIYALDDWKVTNRLTINMGVRWDWFGPVTDAQGKLRNLSYATGEARTINGRLVPMLAPNPNVSKQLYEINWRQIMPRLGIAYRLSDSLVLRTGAGQFYNAQQTNNFSILTLNPPFSGSIVFQNDRIAPTATFEKPFLGSPVAGGPAALVMLGQLRADMGNRSRYLNNDIWQWSMEVEKSFGQNFVIGAAYVGSAASNIDMPVQNANNPDPGLGPVQDRRPDPFYVDSREPEVLLPLGTVRRLETGVSTNYNALQMRAEKRMSKGLTFVASFNFQKAMGIGYGANEAGGFGTRQTQDPRNRLADYGRSNIDQRFRFVFSNIYEFPWFRKERSLRGYVLGGWAVNGIIQLTSGLPVTVTQNGDSQNTGPAGAPRPNIVPGGKVDRVMEDRSVQRWFNTAAFVRSKCDGCPGEGVYLGPKGYGNAGAALFDAPAQKAWDFALFREFAIREKHHVQFRFEAFNFLNTPQFNAPDRTLGSVTFGRITSTALNNRELQFGLKYSF